MSKGAVWEGEKGVFAVKFSSLRSLHVKMQKLGSLGGFQDPSAPWSKWLSCGSGLSVLRVAMSLTSSGDTMWCQHSQDIQTPAPESQPLSTPYPLLMPQRGCILHSLGNVDHSVLCFLFICFFMTALGLHCCTRAFSSCDKSGAILWCCAQSSRINRAVRAPTLLSIIPYFPVSMCS